MNSITIGSDPELFIWNKKTQEVVSSIGLIPGEKGDTYKPEGFPQGYGLQIDNILAEFNIPPVTTKENFIGAINKMKQYIHDFVQAKNPDLTIKCSSSEFVPEHQLDSDQARLFGCSPDFNVYTKQANPSPNGEATNLRTTGCHVHVGYPNPNINQSLLLIKYLDMYLGVPSVIIDTDTRRRELYGKAGCFRLTSFGVEYRTLSGIFIEDDHKMGIVWDQMQKAIKAWQEESPLLNEKETERIINEGDIEAAKKACESFAIIDLNNVWIIRENRAIAG